MGRERELAVLDAAFQRAGAGSPQVVLIEGVAGIGMSRLLEAFLTRHDTGRVVQVQCLPFDADHAFAAVASLLDEPPSTSSEIGVGRRLLACLRVVPSEICGVTVLAVDDAQWMDRPSAHALRFALRRLRRERVLTIIAGRPGSSPGDAVIDAEDATAVIRPAPWGTEASATATAAAADRMLRSVPRPARRIVEASAVLAEPTDAMILGRLAGVDNPFAAVDAAATAGLLVVGPGGLVGCAHAPFREAVYRALTLDARRALHAEAAHETTGHRRLAHRAAAAHQPDAALATELEQAADAARAGRRYDLAAAQRLRARSVSDDPQRRDALLLEALIDRISARSMTDAAELARSADQLSPSARRSLALGLLARETGRIGEARSLLHDAVSSARTSGDQTMSHRAGIAAATLFARVDDGQAALEALGDVDRIADPEIAGDGRSTKGLAMWLIGDTDGAHALLDDVQLSRGGASWEADLLGVRGLIRLYSGRLSLALADVNRAVDLVHLWRPSTDQGQIYALRASLRFWLGDWDGATADAAAARAPTDADSLAPSAALVYAGSSDVAIGRGQWSAARRHLNAARAALVRLPTAQGADAVAGRQTALLLAKRDHAGVLALLEPLRQEDQLARGAPFRSYRWVLPAWIQACSGLRRSSDAERALSDYAEMLHRWPGGPVPSRLGLLRGLVAEGRGDSLSARDHYAEELQDPQLKELPFLHAQSRYAAGRLELALGNPHAAIDYLTEAQATFVELRAQPSIDRCVAQLNACGIGSTVSGSHALSSREAHVLALVVRDYTNKEVAAELHISVKTVEYHLGRIYAKLGVTSRHELRKRRVP